MAHVAQPPLATMGLPPGATAQEAAEAEAFAQCLDHWQGHPVAYVIQVLGLQPDPWQCDVLDALMVEENVALRACHGVGKTALLAWTILWFTTTRPFPKVPTTAPTFNKQVRDILWAEVHKWWRIGQWRVPTLTGSFELGKTRLQHALHPEEWFAVGIASSLPINMEGYHSAHLLAIFDEAKGIGKATWEAVHGMRTTQEAKLLAASTPGGPLGEFFHVFTRYRETWKSLFVIHPRALQATLRRPEVPYWEAGRTQADAAKGGTYYSDRVRPEWIHERALEWGTDSPVYTARCIGDFPAIAGDVLIPYTWLSEAEDREEGASGPIWVSCDVARHGRDRTVALVGRGGTLLHCETIARTPQESTPAQEIAEHGIGDDPRHPRYRGVDVTVDLLQRLRRQFDADGIIVDDTGLAGVADMLRRRGERVVPISFGASPTDKPQTPEQRESKQRRHLLDTPYANIKAQMGMRVREGFEVGAIAFGQLPRHIVDTLIAQASMMKTDIDAHGRLRLVDPDEQAEPAFAGMDEGKRSPDHFHALMLLWWATGGLQVELRPRAGAAKEPRIPKGIERIGVPTGRPGSAARPPRAGAVGGQAKHVQRWYR